MSTVGEYYGLRKWLGEVDTIIEGRKIEVRVIDYWERDLGYTRGGNIYINFTELKKSARDDLGYLTDVRGINYHELAHINLSDVTEEEGYTMGEEWCVTYNILEDQRIERIYAGIYRKCQGYFRHMILGMIGRKTLPWVAVYGRRWLVGKEIAEGLERESVMSDEDKERYKILVDGYMIELDKGKRMKIVNEATAILRKYSDLMQEGDVRISGGRGNRLKKETEGAVEVIMKELEEERREKEAEGKGEKKEKEEGEIRSEDGEGRGEKGDNEEGVKEGYGCERGEGRGKITVDERLREELERTEEELEEEIIMMREEIRRIEERGSYRFSANERRTKERLERIMKEIRTGLREGWDRKRKSGVIDIRRAMKSQVNGDVRVFRGYRPSQEGKAELTAVLVLDRSGSMSGEYIRTALGACYVLAEALEAVGSEVGIIAFNDRTEVIKRLGERGRYEEIEASGGTIASDALEMAGKNLRGQRNRVLIVITDGQWSDEISARRIIERMNGEGIETVGIGIGTKLEHGMRHEIRIYDMDELPLVMKRVVVGMVRRFTGLEN